MTRVDVDGREGGGQLLRTALTLSALAERPFEMTGIRANRPSPGLRPQHLACVEAVATLTEAEVSGAEVGADRLGFTPRRPPAGSATVAVGTAGSVTLVFDTVLPLAVGLDAPIRVTASGGTDVKWAPPFDAFRRVKLPLLARYGLAADVSLQRRGFYPVGSGEATLTVAPSSLAPIRIDERGDLRASVHTVASDGLRDADVCERALERVRDRLSLPVAETTATYAETASPGFALLVSLADGTRAGFDALGERGVPAEEVADGVVEDVTTWLDGSAVVDDYLGDQLVLPVAVAGGRVRIPRVSEHVRTNCDLLTAFGYEVRVRKDETAGAVLEAD